MKAKWFKSCVATDENSVHHGRDLPKGGMAVDQHGRLYIQVVTDRGWWEWHWEHTSRTVMLPKALRNAFRDLGNAKKGFYEAEEQKAEYGEFTPEWEVFYRKASNLAFLARCLQKKVDRLAEPILRNFAN